MSNPNFWNKNKKIYQAKYLYLLKNKFIDAYKFGICENIERRLSTYTGLPSVPKFSKFEDNKWIHITYNDIELIEVYYGDNANEYEKILRKMINGSRKKVDGFNYRYLEHYITENADLHNQILKFFSQIKNQYHDQENAKQQSKD